MKLDTHSHNKTMIHWLGQAGFWINLYGVRILIDPYLSDSLAKKYTGKLFPHTRMMSPPILVADLPGPDVVLVTHAHSDHMDPETLGPLSKRFPSVPIIVPRASKSIAQARLPHSRALTTIDAGENLDVGDGLTIHAFPSAHEAFDRTPEGFYPYLGYGMSKGGQRLYHSGDTVLFDKLPALLRDYAPTIALLPINGRDTYRSSNGVPGNMNAAEALSLCKMAGIPHLVPHHFGMFEFNTADSTAIAGLKGNSNGVNVHIPDPAFPTTFRQTGNHDG